MERLYYNADSPFRQVGKEYVLKIFFDLPWGGKFEFETRPIDKYVLHSLIWGIVLAIVATAFFGIF